MCQCVYEYIIENVCKKLHIYLGRHRNGEISRLMHAVGRNKGCRYRSEDHRKFWSQDKNDSQEKMNGSNVHLKYSLN